MIDCDWFGHACEAVTSIAAVAACILAGRGLRTWKDQIAGQAHFESARTFVKAALRVQESFRFVRSRGSGVAELEEARRETTEPKTDARVRVRLHWQRWHVLETAMNEFNAAAIEADVLLPGQMESLTQPVRDAANELYAIMLDVHDVSKVGFMEAHPDDYKDVMHDFFAKADGSDVTDECLPRRSAGRGMMCR